MTGIYFRIQRNGKWEAIEIDQMTDEEMELILRTKDYEFLVSLCKGLAKFMRDRILVEADND
jgi:hypothetical protein